MVLVQEDDDPKTPIRSNRTCAPSKVWKQALRHACLDRVRKRRRFTTTPLSPLPDWTTARHVVAEEMMQLGVSVFSSSSYSKPFRPPVSPDTTTRDNYNNHHNDSMEICTDAQQQQRFEDDDYLVISEEEVHKLMAEVEAELFLQILDERDDLVMQDQISGYQEWESTCPPVDNNNNNNNNNNDDGVICPLCLQANLVRCGPRIVCPNHYNMYQQCALNLENPLNLTLEALRERLRLACEPHLTYCRQNLCFEIVPQGRIMNEEEDAFGNVRNTLVAGCSICGMRMHIA